MEKVLITIVVGVVALAIGILVGFLIRKKIGEAKIGSAEAEAKRILEEGSKDAEAKKNPFDYSPENHGGENPFDYNKKDE